MEDLSEKIVTEMRDGVGHFLIDRAEKRNAMALSMWQRMGEVFEAWSENEHVRVVIVRGAGDKCFCAGNDISEFDSLRSDAAGASRYETITTRAYSALKNFPKPTIARVSGICVGGGLELAQLCDLQISSSDATFGVTPARLGLGYKLSDVMLLTDTVSAKYAKEMLFTGELFPADVAARWGLINRVVPLADLDEAVADLAARIAANAPLSVHAAKMIVGEAVKEASTRDETLCQSLVDACHNSQDYIEGRTAFAEKRKPEFKGV